MILNQTTNKPRTRFSVMYHIYVFEQKEKYKVYQRVKIDRKINFFNKKKLKELTNK